VLDPACAEAVELAFAAAEDVGGIGKVGDHLGVVADGERTATTSSPPASAVTSAGAGR